MRYLAKDVHAELQMGAVSGLADVNSPQATAALLDALPGLAGRNRELALDALLRTEDRAATLLDAIEAGKVDPELLGDRRAEALTAHSSDKVRRRAAAVLKRR